MSLPVSLRSVSIATRKLERAHLRAVFRACPALTALELTTNPDDEDWFAPATDANEPPVQLPPTLSHLLLHHYAGDGAALVTLLLSCPNLTQLEARFTCFSPEALARLRMLRSLRSLAVQVRPGRWGEQARALALLPHLESLELVVLFGEEEASAQPSPVLMEHGKPLLRLQRLKVVCWPANPGAERSSQLVTDLLFWVCLDQLLSVSVLGADLFDEDVIRVWDRAPHLLQLRVAGSRLCRAITTTCRDDMLRLAWAPAGAGCLAVRGCPCTALLSSLAGQHCTRVISLCDDGLDCEEARRIVLAQGIAWTRLPLKLDRQTHDRLCAETWCVPVRSAALRAGLRLLVACADAGECVLLCDSHDLRRASLLAACALALFSAGGDWSAAEAAFTQLAFPPPTVLNTIDAHPPATLYHRATLRQHVVVTALLASFLGDEFDRELHAAVAEAWSGCIRIMSQDVHYVLVLPVHMLTAGAAVITAVTAVVRMPAGHNARRLALGLLTCAQEFTASLAAAAPVSQRHATFEALQQCQHNVAAELAGAPRPAPEAAATTRVVALCAVSDLCK
eukprot:TRINITY_DN4715_c0_g1_i3.p1 TRINITY_DN4715_c0_g1~~TRINITY_DN4715_c0_g1_i3.p1  ORF type:complete len:565 (-),score=110.48 TRINITY_DN4715_c0_g1_i3:9-1703(-)